MCLIDECLIYTMLRFEASVCGDYDRTTLGIYFYVFTLPSRNIQMVFIQIRLAGLLKNIYIYIYI